MANSSLRSIFQRSGGFVAAMVVASVAVQAQVAPTATPRAAKHAEMKSAGQHAAKAGYWNTDVLHHYPPSEGGK